MKFRKVIIFSGAAFRVPESIQRIDSDSTHGWQLRYGPGKTEMFSDHSNDGSGAARSLKLAKAALHQRVQKLPAPSGLMTQVRANKTSDLPVGISGPTERSRNGRNTPYYAFQVSVPRPQAGSTTRSVYIGTANTFSPEREAEALEKAIAIRDSAVRAFKTAATKAKRAASAKLLPR